MLSHNTKIHNFLLTVICFAYIGAAAENLAFACGGILILLWLLHKVKLISVLNSKLFYTGLFVISHSFLIMMLAPGNEARVGIYGTTQTLRNAFFINIKVVYSVLFWLKPAYLKFLLLSIFPSILVSKYFNININEKKIVRTVIVYSGIYFLVIFFYVFPTTYALGTILPDRGYMFIDALTLLLVMSFSILLGAYLHKQIYYLTATFSLFSAIFLILYTIDFIKTDYTIVQKYALAYDQRIEYIKNSAKNPELAATDTIYLTPLPVMNHIVIRSAELSEDECEGCWVNRSIRGTYGLSSEIKLKK
jgi:hypothetical protein